MAFSLSLPKMHHAVMLGDANAAQILSDEFAAVLSDITPKGVDKTRAERYWQLALALDEMGPDLRLPNLNRVLPLPPAPLPFWDSKRTSLVWAAQLIIPRVVGPVQEVLSGRAHIPQGHVLELPGRNSFNDRPVNWETGMQSPQVMQTGYWQAMLLDEKLTQPMHFEAGERLPHPPGWENMTQHQRYNQFCWIYRGVAVPERIPQHNLVSRGVARSLDVRLPLPQCMAGTTCTKSGIWLAFLPKDAELAQKFNIWRRQTYVGKGEIMPGADYWRLEDEFQGIPASQITWRLVEPWQGGSGAWIGKGQG